MRPFIYGNYSPYANKPFVVEEWRRVDDTVYKYADGPCWISTCGRVYNENMNQIIQPSVNRDGYYTMPIKFVLPDGSKRYTSALVNRTVLLAFAPREDSDSLESNHNDGFKFNNHILNLCWCTRAENNLFCHMNQQRIQPKGLSHYKAKLTEDELVKICELLRDGYSCSYVSKTIGCTYSMVSHILHGWTYKEYYDKYKLYELAKPKTSK